MVRVRYRGARRTGWLTMGAVLLAVSMLSACSGSEDGGDASPGGSVAPVANQSPPADSSATTSRPESGAGGAVRGPHCANLTVTPAQTEGPYFTPGSPERTSLREPGMVGTGLVISGQVLTTDYQPVAGARVDFWQPDDAGRYDNTGYTLRGHQFTDDGGHYRLETIVPGLYPGRTRHIHVKVQPPGGAVLTTQLYLPDEPVNTRDRVFTDTTVVAVVERGDTITAAYNFVLQDR